MKKVILISSLVVLLVGGAVLAKGVERNPATVLPNGKTVIVPDKAVDNSPVLERAIFIHYKKGFAKPGTECGNGICEAGENARKCPQDCEGADTKCYGFLSKGVMIKSPKDLTVHSDLNLDVVSASVSEWDKNTLTDLFSSISVDDAANWDSTSPDGRNELSYGNYPESDVIGVTVVWGYFSGPPQTREITEFDILFDTDFTWGDATVNPTVMDLENITVHEMGHGLGLDDIYDGSCNEVTMYGYSTEGETKKRTLESGDITGLQKLYGN